MTHTEDIQRVRGELVRGELKWDSFPCERAAAKVICIREESERRIANALQKPGVNPNMVVNCFIAMTVIAFLGTAAFYAIRIVWVR